MNKTERGKYGYLSQRKGNAWFLLALDVTIAMAICAVGVLVGTGAVKKIALVLVILMVLPSARSLIAIIMLIPYKPMKAERKRFFDAALSDVDSDSVFYDVVFTSPESRMHLDLIIVSGTQVIGFTERKKDDISKIDRYFRKEFASRHLNFSCFITDSEKALLNRLKAKGDGMPGSAEQYNDFLEVKSFIKTSII